jgi:thioredoxin 2
VDVLTQTVCPACATPNGTAQEFEPRTVKCARCGAALFQGVPLEADDDLLQLHITHTTHGVLVVIWAPWCGACRFVESDLVIAASRLEPGVRLLKLNTSANEAANTFGLRGIPALLLFKSGQEIARTIGPLTADEIIGWTQARLRTSKEEPSQFAELSPLAAERPTPGEPVRSTNRAAE